MTLEFMTIDVDIPDSVGQLHQAIEVRLAAYGSPLRWAVTSIESIDSVGRKAHVDAVIVVDWDASVA